jgi:rfaE bifunctional protein kinase chain/domain
VFGEGDSRLLNNEAIGDRQDLLSLVRSFPERHVVVVGDLVADQFLSGSISRVSREAPVLILSHEHTETAPGGAANCAANLAALGSRVSLVGAVGDDPAGLALTQKLEATGVDCAGVVSVPGFQTTTKVRILAGQLRATRQQVLRVDYNNQPARAGGMDQELCRRFSAVSRQTDAIIISDYDYGVAGELMIDTVRSSLPQRSVPVLVDSRFRLLSYSGFTTATPNEDEVEQLLNRRLAESGELESACGLLRQELGCEALLVTRGSQGMLLLERDRAPRELEAVGSRQPVDVTGAGDTVIATYALGLAGGASFFDAARIANHAGGLVVMKRGTATISPGELTGSLIGSVEE